MSIILKTVRASCPHCPHKVAQIDTDYEHAVDVVTAAMEAHIAENHAAGAVAVRRGDTK